MPILSSLSIAFKILFTAFSISGKRKGSCKCFTKSGCKNTSLSTSVFTPLLWSSCSTRFSDILDLTVYFFIINDLIPGPSPCEGEGRGNRIMYSLFFPSPLQGEGLG